MSANGRQVPRITDVSHSLFAPAGDARDTGRQEGHEGHGTPSTRATPLTIAKALLSSKTPEGFNIYRKQSATLLEARPQRGHIGETWLRSSTVSPRSQCRCGIKQIFFPRAPELGMNNGSADNQKSKFGLKRLINKESVFEQVLARTSRGVKRGEAILRAFCHKNNQAVLRFLKYGLPCPLFL